MKKDDFYSPEYNLISQARKVARKLELNYLRGCRDKKIKTEAEAERHVRAVQAARARLQRRRRTLLPKAHCNIYGRAYGV